MKIIIEKSGCQDVIIEQDSRVVKINNGKDIKFIDEKEGIAEFNRYVKAVYLYENEYDEGGLTGNAKRVILNKEHILAIADKIREIEASKYDDIYAPLDDLPF